MYLKCSYRKSLSISTKSFQKGISYDRIFTHNVVSPLNCRTWNSLEIKLKQQEIKIFLSLGHSLILLKYSHRIPGIFANLPPKTKLQGKLAKQKWKFGAQKRVFLISKTTTHSSSCFPRKFNLWSRGWALLGSSNVVRAPSGNSILITFPLGLSLEVLLLLMVLNSFYATFCNIVTTRLHSRSKSIQSSR